MNYNMIQVSGLESFILAFVYFQIAECGQVSPCLLCRGLQLTTGRIYLLLSQGLGSKNNPCCLKFSVPG
jgi:hypothetical protein